jgi:hypothetical protein
MTVIPALAKLRPVRPDPTAGRRPVGPSCTAVALWPGRRNLGLDAAASLNQGSSRARLSVLPGL